MRVDDAPGVAVSTLPPGALPTGRSCRPGVSTRGLAVDLSPMVLFRIVAADRRADGVVGVGGRDRSIFGDVRYIGGAIVESHLSNIHVRVRNPALAGTLGALGYSDDIRVGNADIKLHLNTLIYSAGIGYRF